MTLSLLLVFSMALTGHNQSSVFWELQTPTWGTEVYPETVRDVVDMQDGRLAVVGERRINDDNKDGFLLFFNPTAQALEYAHVFAHSDEDVFTCAARAHDGSLYVGGHSLDPSGLKRALLVHFDPTGKLLHTFNLEGPPGSWFEKIVWMPGNFGLVAGFRPEKDFKGSVWLLKIEGERQPQHVGFIGAGIAQDLKAMLASERTSKVWLCGNAQNRKDGKPSGDVWLAQMDSTSLKNHKCQSMPTPSLKENMTSACLANDDGLLMAGNVVEGKGEAWAKEITTDWTERFSLTFGTAQPDTATAICQTPGQNQAVFCAFTSASMRGPDTRTYLWQKVTERQDFQNRLDGSLDNFQVKAIAPLDDNNLLLAGFKKIEIGADPRNRVIFAPIQQAENRGKNRGKARGGLGTESAEIKSLRVAEGCLSPGKTATVYIEIENKGNEPISFASIGFKIANLPGAEKTITPVNLKPGETRRFSQGIEIPGNKASSLKFKVRFVSKDKTTLIDEKEFDVPLCAEETGLAANPQPSPSSGDARGKRGNADLFIKEAPKSPTNQSLTEVEIAIRNNNPKPMPSGDVIVKVKKNNRRKSRAGQVADEGVTHNGNDTYDHKFRCTEIELDTGVNEITFALVTAPGDTVDFTNLVTVVYNPNKPALHVFVIGPSYSPPFNLDFVEADVSAFAKAMDKQRGAGWFEEVYIETLAAPQPTGTDQIKLFLSEIGQKRHINPIDYLVVFFAGHGFKKKNGGLLLMANGYKAGNEDVFGVEYDQWIKERLKEIECKKIIFVDACHSGEGRSTPGEGKDADKDRANRITSGSAVFYSSQSEQLSLEDKIWQHGVFTFALLEALDGKKVKLFDGSTADPDGGYPDPRNSNRILGKNDGRMTVSELRAFLDARVPDLVEDYNQKNRGNAKQNPQVMLRPDMALDTVIFAIPKN